MPQAKALFTLFFITFTFRVASFAALMQSTDHLPNTPKLQNGKLNMYGWDFSEEGNYVLDGHWAFYNDTLIAPKDIHNNVLIKPLYVAVPSQWNEYKIGTQNKAALGVGTYHLTIYNYIPTRLLALEINRIMSNYMLWVNGRKIISNGTLSAVDSLSQPRWSPQLAVFGSQSDTLDIVLQVSNFHYRFGGFVSNVSLGTPDLISRQWESKTAITALSIGALMFFGLFFICIFLLWRKHPANFYFASLCFLWAVRVCFSGRYLAIFIFPALPWGFISRLDHISVYLSLIAGTSFINASFPGLAHRYYINTLIAINYLCVAAVTALPSHLFSFISQPYQVFLLFNISYLFYIVSKAIRTEIKEAWFSAGGAMVALFVFACDVLSQSNVLNFNPHILNLGYLSVFFLNALVLTFRFSISKRAQI